MVRIRQLGGYEVKETLPLNYDLLEELANKCVKLEDMMSVDNRYDFVLNDEKVLNHALTSHIFRSLSNLIPITLWCTHSLNDVEEDFCVARVIFNLACDEKQKHVEGLNSCDEPSIAWELFNRIQYLINNFETEILLSDMEMKNE